MQADGIMNILRIDSSAQARGSIPYGLAEIGIEDVRLVGAQGAAGDSEAATRVALSQLGAWLPQNPNHNEESRYVHAS